MGTGSQANLAGVKRQWVPPPVFRHLRVFPVDPSVAARFETAGLNEETLRIPWEKLAPGPVGEYVAVVEDDRKVKGAVDLDSPELLAQRGLPPSDGNPQFRHQMVYAVAMQTIRNFERALGRAVHWAPETDENGVRVYRRQLDLYPHHSLMPNAYYDSSTGLCFGYFEAKKTSPFPGTCVFTCLSQDVIAHELTHALLEGMNIEADTESFDVVAFHEGFATLVSLFQHFRNSDVLRQQISAVRGDLGGRSLLGVVAPQLGQAIGLQDGLSNALGEIDQQGNWQPRKPDPKLYATLKEPHARGTILVAAVFEAFKKIYDSRVADLRRIASRGTGTLPEGHLHPDLVGRLTREAGESAGQVLDMCIRALDYLPPVEYTFADYLRAIITADYDLFPVDPRRYRLAFVDAFRSYGIQPSELVTLSIDTLRWPESSNEGGAAGVVADFVQELSTTHSYWNLPREREALWTTLEGWKEDLTQRLKAASRAKATRRLGVINLTKAFEIVSFDLRTRAGYEGDLLFQWVIKIVQRSGRYGVRKAGTTLLVDAETGRVRLQIDKKTAASQSSGNSATRPLLERAGEGAIVPPVTQRLRVFAVDPGLGVQLETAGINEVVLEVPWEDTLQPGPVSEYLETIDRDPASGCSYAPVDLRAPSILAEDGLTPSESNPQFHQQMVYAVSMRTIRNFERALGRLALWSPRRGTDPDGRWKDDEYVQQLRIYPHALREANAYYSPAKKAVLFGYFPAPVEQDAAGSARLTVFTCVSHDIIAHEVTHALLDGIHRRFNEATNPDMLAFHEAFADIVALFQHFSLPDVLHDQIAATRGDLASQNRLGELARQFGEAIGNRGALRNAIGKADPEAYQRELEPHARGAILVAAVFDAFLTIYKAQVADLLRIYTDGTGVLPEGRLHPDLVNRLADEAAKSAGQVLDMCIRALDYCPPVDVTFGDYLRAVVTADFESDPLDEGHRRVAFVEAFRRRGIVPADIRTLSADGLLWPPASDRDEDVVIDHVMRWAVDIGSWNLSKSRSALFDMMSERRAALHTHLARMLEEAGGSLVLRGIVPRLPFEVHSIRPSMRFDWDNQPRFQWVVELTQRVAESGPPPYTLRGGCTLLIDAETGKVRYAIENGLDAPREERQRQYILEDANQSLAATYFGSVNELSEPFAMIHRM